MTIKKPYTSEESNKAVVPLSSTDTLDVGAGAVTHAGDVLITAPVLATDLALYIPLTQKAAALGVATLDSAGKLTDSQVPTAPVTSVNGAVDDVSISVNGHTGTTITVTADDLGLGSVDNSADAAKPVSTAQQAALDLKQSLTDKAQPSGYASLDGSGIVPIEQLPPLGGSPGSTNSAVQFNDVGVFGGDGDYFVYDENTHTVSSLNAHLLGGGILDWDGDGIIGIGGAGVIHYGFTFSIEGQGGGNKVSIVNHDSGGQVDFVNAPSGASLGMNLNGAVFNMFDGNGTGGYQLNMDGGQITGASNLSLSGTLSMANTMPIAWDNGATITTDHNGSMGGGEIFLNADNILLNGACSVSVSNDFYVNGTFQTGALNLLTGNINYYNPSGGQGLYWYYSGSGASISGNVSTGTVDVNSLGLRILSPSNNAFLEFADGETAGVSVANEGRITYNTANQRFEQSVNGGTYIPFGIPSFGSANSVQLSDGMGGFITNNPVTYDGSTFIVPGDLDVNASLNGSDAGFHFGTGGFFTGNTDGIYSNIYHSFTSGANFTSSLDITGGTLNANTVTGYFGALVASAGGTIGMTDFTSLITSNGIGTVTIGAGFIVLDTGCNIYGSDFNNGVVVNSSLTWPSGSSIADSGSGLNINNLVDPTSSQMPVTLAYFTANVPGVGPVPKFDFSTGDSEPVSASGQMRLRYSSSGNDAEISINGSPYVGLGTYTPLTGQLLDSSAVLSVDYQGRKLYDPSAYSTTVDYGVGQLIWGFNTVYDWQQGFLYSNGYGIAIKLNSWLLYDTNNFKTSLDWMNRTLNDTSGTVQLTWLSGGIKMNHVGFNNVTPVAQSAAIVNATNATDVITQLNTLLAYLRTRGDIHV